MKVDIIFLSTCFKFLSFFQAEAEMKRKMELIQQIRALESMPKDRNKMVDWTATAGHSLLSEMSIAEVGDIKMK